MDMWAAGLVALAVLVALLARSWRGERVRRSFDDIVFQTPSGPMPGRSMRVVKRVVESAGLPQGGDGLTGAFWYCVGPGPSYFVAIGTPASAWPRRRLDWAVRPLSAERMRGALTGDAEAMAAAFGEPAGDDLRPA